MKLEQWTLFVDMLGYRDINGSITNDDDAESFMDFMESNVRVFEAMNGPAAKKFYKTNDEFNLYAYYDVSSCFVSDSMIITFKPREVAGLVNEDLAMMHSANALFIIAMRLQPLIYSCFSQKGIFLRGGVSNKYAKIQGHFAVGEGLIEAYKAESELARNPRIVLHPEIQANARLLEKINFLEDKMYGGRGILQRDPIDGLLFIDYLGYTVATIDTTIEMIAGFSRDHPERFRSHQEQVSVYLQSHAEALRAKLSEIQLNLDQSTEDDEREKIIRVLNKFIWLREYHNRIAASHPMLTPHEIV